MDISYENLDLIYEDDNGEIYYDESNVVYVIIFNDGSFEIAPDYSSAKQILLERQNINIMDI